MDSFTGGDYIPDAMAPGPDYIVVCGSALRMQEFRSKVIALLEAGYQLVGGVMPDGLGRLYQALIRRK